MRHFPKQQHSSHVWVLSLCALCLMPIVATIAWSQGDPACDAIPSGRVVPARFVSNRVFAQWHTNTVGDLLLYTDTGGGMVSLYPEAVMRLAVAVDTVRWHRGTEWGMRLVVKVPRVIGDSLFPLPLDSNPAFARFLVQYDEQPPQDAAGLSWDGRLGSLWFANGVWTFDYPNRRLYFNDSAIAGPQRPDCWVPIGFQIDSLGRRTNSFPRITARIDGEPIEFLLDTGARTQLTDDALAVIHPTEPRFRAASFIIQDRLDAWHKQHPDWPVVPRAEETTGFAMIRVPEIEIGKRRVGPVWFTARPNNNFRKFMSQYMDRPIEGALGGSAWKYVVLIVDYPRARAALLVPYAR
jgi:hypothetical protein